MSEFEHSATYSPEDNKLRLYFGSRIPREQWDELKAQGWTWTMKQDSDMCAHWTPKREDTALELAGFIDNEDSTRDDRAADRAERFSGYLDKRLEEASTHATNYESGPSVHGHQSQQKAEQRARKHDKQALKACNQWDKAEYWQRRTSGVIANALHLDKPAVRACRIKELKKEIARKDKTIADWGSEDKYAQRAARWSNQLSMRLAYEEAIYTAQVGETFESLNIETGGCLGSHVLHRVNKSTLTGECNSVGVLDPKTLEVITILTTQFKAADYTAPTEESKKLLKAQRAQMRANKTKSEGVTLPLINPTDEDAERLQALLNALNAEKHKKWNHEPAGVLRITQAVYSANSKGAYKKLETKELSAGAKIRHLDHYGNRPNLPSIVKLRGDWGIAGRVVIITDKPQKALPPELFVDPIPAMQAAFLANKTKTSELLTIAALTWTDKMTAEQRELFTEARTLGFAYLSSMSQFGLSTLGKHKMGTQEVTA